MLQIPASFVLEPDYYQVLQLEPEATKPEVEQAFKRQSAALNLDQRAGNSRLENAEALLELTSAFEVLSDPMQRSHYDIRRFSRAQLPLADEVQQLFKSGVQAYRQNRLDLALRFYKETVRLYPHRSLFRVHLAIAFAEKSWLTNAENELESALRLDPEDRFAKETVARLLFEYESFSREPREPLIKRVGTGLLSMVRTGPLGRGRKTDQLND